MVLMAFLKVAPGYLRFVFFFSSRRRHTRFDCDWSSDVCSSDLLEGSWDNYYYTREWNVPPDVQVVVMPPTTGAPGGAGEFGVPASMAAVACAYWQATGVFPTNFPIN